MTLEMTAGPAHAGTRLSVFLSRIMGISSSQIKSAKWENRILVNGSPEFVSYLLREGDRVTLLPQVREAVYRVAPMDLPLNIPYTDPWLLIVDKPARLATSSSLRYPDDALENALFAHLGCPENYVFRPVNRLDKGTSGLLCVARDPYTQNALQQQLHTPDFRRTYLAVTDGVPPCAEGTISLPIAKAEGPTIRREIRPDGKPSVTHYQVLFERGGRALVRLSLETGRTHQIRVHLSALGTPVFGDFLYGRESDSLRGRFALHSESLTLTHPATGKKLSLTSPLPGELTRLLD